MKDVGVEYFLVGVLFGTVSICKNSSFGGGHLFSGLLVLIHAISTLPSSSVLVNIFICIFNDLTDVKLCYWFDEGRHCSNAFAQVWFIYEGITDH